MLLGPDWQLRADRIDDLGDGGWSALVGVRRDLKVGRQRAAAAAKARSLESWLGELSRDDLLALVREQVSEDRVLRRRLELVR
jgi:hypothetical protein